jgi:ABC-type sugar transport system permease subunit
MMDNGGGAALLYFAIIAVFIGTVVYPGIIATIIVLAIKLFKRKLTRRKLLILWVILFVLISLALRWVISPNFPTNREVLIKMPDY